MCIYSSLNIFTDATFLCVYWRCSPSEQSHTPIPDYNFPSWEYTSTLALGLRQSGPQPCRALQSFTNKIISFALLRLKPEIFLQWAFEYIWLTGGNLRWEASALSSITMFYHYLDRTLFKTMCGHPQFYHFYIVVCQNRNVCSFTPRREYGTWLPNYREVSTVLIPRVPQAWGELRSRYDLFPYLERWSNIGICVLRENHDCFSFAFQERDYRLRNITARRV